MRLAHTCEFLIPASLDSQIWSQSWISEAQNVTLVEIQNIHILETAPTPQRKGGRRNMTDSWRVRVFQYRLSILGIVE